MKKCRALKFGEQVLRLAADRHLILASSQHIVSRQWCADL